MSDIKQWHVTTKINGNLDDARLIILNWHYNNDWDDFDITRINNGEDNVLESELSDFLKAKQNPIWTDRLKRNLIAEVFVTFNRMYRKQLRTILISNPTSNLQDADSTELTWSPKFIKACKKELRYLTRKNISLEIGDKARDNCSETFKNTMNDEIQFLLSQIDVQKHKPTDFSVSLRNDLFQVFGIQKNTMKLPYYFQRFFWPLVMKEAESPLDCLNKLYDAQDEPGDPAILYKISHVSICTVDVYVDYGEINYLEFKNMVESIGKNTEIRKICNKVVADLNDFSKFSKVVAVGYTHIWSKILLNSYKKIDDTDVAEINYRNKIENQIYAMDKLGYGLRRDNLHLVYLNDNQYSEFQMIFG